MSGLTDLHLHSNRSDGAESPTRLVEMAAEAGVTTMALVDHDVLDGLDEARGAAESHEIHFIPGIELSVEHNGTKMHMLVYFVEDEPGPLQAKLAWLREGRNERNSQIVKNLNDLGFEITIDDVLRWAAGKSVGRPHIADALVEIGAVKSRDEAFDGLLQDGGLVYLDRNRLSASEAIALSRAGGGVPVVAHPKTISGGAADYAALFDELVDAGLGGIEAHHASHSPELREHLTTMAHRLGIAATGGSDFHGNKNRDFRIGVGTGDLRVPDTAVSELLAQRE
ncbi:MAG: PHP domain-containing protein [Armatimonadetes bacterium]|nr:MAG: PHP domain-containing protein [Armatimonadota bacterium]